MKIISVDPGKGGAIALLEDHRLVWVRRTPKSGSEYDEQAILDLFEEARAGEGHISFVIEAASARPTESRMSSLTIGIGWGMWWGIAMAQGLPRRKIHPQAWKAKMGLTPPRRKKGDQSAPPPKLTMPERKALAIARAQQLCPDVPALRHDGCAEAYLLGLYAWEHLFRRS